MQTVLTLNIDQTIVKNAEIYAQNSHQSVSRLVEDFLVRLPSADTKTASVAADKRTKKSSFGSLNRYADPSKIPYEKEAWGMAVAEKHAIN